MYGVGARSTEIQARIRAIATIVTASRPVSQ
jgi:hypothetical protein